MANLITVNNNEVVFKLNLNYNTLYAKLRILCGEKDCIFADVKSRASQTSWFAPESFAGFKPLSEASSSEREQVLRKLRQDLSSVSNMLSSHKDIAPFVEDLLEVPDDKFIFFAQAPELKVMLAAWGCRLAHVSGDPTGTLSSIVGGSANLQEVVLKAVDYKGVPIKGQLMLDYDSEHVKFSTDASGEKFLGKYVVGNVFYVTDLESSTKQSFTVTQGCRNYFFQTSAPATVAGSGIIDGVSAVHHATEDRATAPEERPERQVAASDREIVEEFVLSDDKTVPFQKVILRVSDTGGEILPCEKIEVAYSSQVAMKYADKDGLINIGALPIGSEFSAALASDRLQSKKFTVQADREIYDFHCHIMRLSTPVISVEDSDGNSMPDRDICVLVSGVETVYSSGTNGIVTLQPMKEGEHFIVHDADNKAQFSDFTVSSEKDVYRFIVGRKKEKVVTLRVVDAKSNPVKGCEVHLSIGGEDCMVETDGQGLAQFPHRLFGDEETIPVTCITAQRKTYDSSIEYTPDSSDYFLKIGKKRFNPWLVIAPLLACIAGALGFLLLHKPSDDKMMKGIVIVQTQCIDYAVLKDPDGDIVNTLYFTYDRNHGSFGKWFYLGYSSVEEVISACQENEFPSCGYGTGFFISRDGEIATNKHVADPDVVSLDELNKEILKHMNQCAYIAKNSNDREEVAGNLKFYEKYHSFRYPENGYKVEVKSDVIDISVAYTGTIMQTGKDLADFHSCTFSRISGNSTDEDDISIIQLKKPMEMPKDAYIFRIPKAASSPAVEGKEIKVIGYGDGLGDANIETGIKPQVAYGKIAGALEPYYVIYDASTMGGMSGSPVVDRRGRLIALHSKSRQSNIRAYGVKSKYLRKLYDELHKDDAGKK